MDFAVADRIVEEAIDRQPELMAQRYLDRHQLRRDPAMSVELVRQHWRTETTLSRILRQSEPVGRPAEFERAYGQFYQELYWLNEWKKMSSGGGDAFAYGFFTRLLGKACDIYEVGSGKGELIRFLASKGYRCTATEITAERGKKWHADSANLTWKSSDGVHLAEFEPEASQDAVISNQVIEHIHPDDLPMHFQHAARILRNGGRYILSTPHKFLGPSDISGLFGLEEPMGFHLREYSYRELTDMAKAAGFSRIEAVYLAPQAVRRYVPLCFPSAVYLRLLLGLESLAAILPRKRRKQLFRLLQMAMLLRRDVFLCLTK